MATRLILYDFGPEERPAEGPVGEDVYFPAQPLVQRCLGCFGCWVKTPGRCVLQDRASVLPELLKHCDEWIILSPIVYGGYSVCVKAAIERCLGYFLPYLQTSQGRMRHWLRYPHHAFRLRVCFYGPCLAEEREIARRLVFSNSRNLGARQWQADFWDAADQAKEAIGWKF